MKLIDAQSVAEQLIKQWLNEPWKIEFNYSKTSLGICHSNNRIEFSKSWIAILSSEEVVDTIKHEIAHAYCFENKINDNHGKNWKKIAEQIGAKPLECYNGKMKAPSRFMAECCGIKYKSGSLSNRRIFCAACSKKLDYKDIYAGI